MRKAFKFRIYPNKKQQEFLSKQFGSVRFTYNYFLEERQTAYKTNKKSLNYHDNCRSLTELKTKEKYSWLKGINSQSLQSAVKDLQRAYDNFFEKRARYPKPKKKHGKQCFKIPQHFRIDNDHLWIPKLHSGIRLVQHREIEGRIICCFISKTRTDKYYVSFLCEADIEPLPILSNTVGIDLGIKNLITTDSGETVENPKYLKTLDRKRRYKSRQHSKKQKGTKNRERARKEVAKLYERVSNARNDNLHKLSKKVIDENQVIIAESLKIVNMLKRYTLAFAIQDASWGELLRQLEYKARFYGRTFHKIDTFFPSSKTCSNCQHELEELPLSVRKWDCPNCGMHHDRDVNAACNIKRQGLQDLNLSDIGMLSDIKQKHMEALTAVISHVDLQQVRSKKYEAHDFSHG